MATILSMTTEEAARGDYESCLKRASVEWGGFGVEYIPSKQDTPYEMRGISYVNMGDPYIRTILIDHGRKGHPALVTSWGDYVEMRPSRFG